MFFGALNSFHGSVGVDFCHAACVENNNSKTHTVPISVNGEVDWGNDIIRNAYRKTQCTK